MTAEKPRLLVITSLFPTRSRPARAPFNRQQFCALSELAEVDVCVTDPWRPGKPWSASDVWPSQKAESQLSVSASSFLSVPGFSSFNAGSMVFALWPRLRTEVATKKYHAIVGSYAYPEGCAAVVLGRMLNTPVVVKCHGSDLNRVPRDLGARIQLKRLLKRAAGVVVVSQGLKESAMALGVPKEKLSVLYNGIDRSRFFPRDRHEARRALSLPLDREVVLCVGHLAPHKGTNDLLKAAVRVAERRPKASLVFVGDGPLRNRVLDRAERMVDPSHVISVGPVPHDEVPLWYGASDVLCVPSWSEGLPNVIREAHASGRPVVATRVGGAPEAIHSPELGSLVSPRRPKQLADALLARLADPGPTPERIVELAQTSSWSENARAFLDLIEGFCLKARV